MTPGAAGTSCARCADRAAIERLMTEYVRRIDAGDLEGFAELFRWGTWNHNRGVAETLQWLQEHVILYDGAPLTHHVMSNVAIDVDLTGSTAAATCYITVFQKTPDDQEAHVITANSYVDSFARRDDGWSFTERVVVRRLAGDTTRHIRGSTVLPGRVGHPPRTTRD
jgi:hypothetical protein